MKTIRIAVLALASSGLAALAAAQNNLLIDDFTQGPDTLFVNNSNGYIEGQQSGSNILGQQRDVLLQATANPFDQPISLAITGDPNRGATLLNNNPGSSAWFALDYDGFDVEANDGTQTAGHPGLGDNLAGYDGFKFTFLNSDSPVKIEATAQTYGPNGQLYSATASTTTMGGLNSASDYFLSFKDFGAGSGVDWSKVDRLNFKFTPTNASSDFALGKISAAAQPVPEPASLATVAVGFLVLLRKRVHRAV